MKDIELPDHWLPLGLVGTNASFQRAAREYAEEYASAAVEADRAQRVPDWSHPKVQALIGSDARKRIQIDLLWRILENPNDDFGPSDMEYWDAIHDRLKSSLLASTPAQPAQQTLPEAMKTVISEMQSDPDYAWTWHCNVAMAMVDAGCDPVKANQGAARFMRVLADVEPAHELPSAPAQPAQQERQIAEALRRLGLALVKKASGYDVIEMGPATAQHQEPPQPVERKPMTDEVVRDGFASCWVGGINARLGFVEGVKFTERHYGIRE